VTLRNLSEASAASAEIGLRELLSSLGSVAAELKRSLLGTLVDQGGVSASLAAMSLPRNAHALLLRADVVAAIHSAFDRVSNGCAHLRRRVLLYELIEGGCQPLSMRFAEVVAHVLQSTRVSCGQTAMQVPKPPLLVNAMQARVAYQRLVSMIEAYERAVPVTPTLVGAGQDNDGGDVDNGAVRAARCRLLKDAAGTKTVVAAPLGNRWASYGVVLG